MNTILAILVITMTGSDGTSGSIALNEYEALDTCLFMQGMYAGIASQDEEFGTVVSPFRVAEEPGLVYSVVAFKDTKGNQYVLTCEYRQEKADPEA